MNFLDGLHSYEIILLILGILFFVVLLAALIYLVVKNRSIKNLPLFFLFPVLMIGYPSIQNFKLGNDWIYVEKVKERITQNPDDSIAKADLNQKLKVLESRPIKNQKFLETIAEAEAAVGDSLKALEISEEILQRNPQSQTARQLKERLSTPTVKLDRDIVKLQANPDDQQAQQSLTKNLKGIENALGLNPYVNYQAARAHLALGDTSKAVSRLDTTIKYDPNNRKAKALRYEITVSRTLKVE